MSGPKFNSNLAIAKLLDSEGYTDYVSSMVTKYALHRATEGQKKRFKRNKKLFSDMVRDALDEKEKLVLGKYFGVKLSMAFDTGLRMGLVAYLNLSDEQRANFICDAFEEEEDQ